jgi:hypothetical protein
MTGGWRMYVVCSFHHTFEIELLLAKLEESGFLREEILVMPLKQEKDRLYKISATSTGGNNLMDIPLAIGTVCMLLGVIYGFVLYLGPILWGLFGLLGGTLGSLLIVYWVNREVIRKKKKMKGSEVFVMVRCRPELERNIEEIVQSFLPIGFGILDIPGAERKDMIRPQEVRTVES